MNGHNCTKHHFLALPSCICWPKSQINQASPSNISYFECALVYQQVSSRKLFYRWVVKWSLNSLKLVTDEGGFYAHEILLENRIYFLHKLAHFRHHVTFQLQEYDPLTLQPSWNLGKACYTFTGLVSGKKCGKLIWSKPRVLVKMFTDLPKKTIENPLKAWLSQAWHRFATDFTCRTAAWRLFGLWKWDPNMIILSKNWGEWSHKTRYKTR